MSLATYDKDPEAILDYEIDWSDWLGALTISTSTWTVPTVPSGLTSVSTSHTNTVALIRLSGGAWGTSYEVTNHIVASNGEADDRTITIKVAPR